MSAYDNPRIINDQSAMAWANASAKVTQTMLQGIQNVVKFRNEQKAIAAAKQEKFNSVWTAASLTQNKNLTDAVTTAKANPNADKTLIEQFQRIQETLMQGGEGVMGSIEAQTLLMTKSNLSREERNELQNIVNRSNTNMASIVNDGGKIMTDVELIKSYAGSSGPQRTMFWEGGSNGVTGQIASQLAGMSLSNIAIDGVKSTKKATHTSEGNFVTIESTLKKSNDLVKNLDLNKDFIKDNGDGTVTFKWQKNMSQWDGNLLNKTEDGTDYDKIAKEQGIDENGELAKSFRTPLNAITSVGKDGYQNVISREFVDTQALDNKFESTLKGRAASILGMDNPEAIQAYLEQRLGMGEVNIKKFLEKTQADKVKTLTELEMVAMREHYDLVPEVDGIDAFDKEELKDKINPKTGVKYTEQELANMATMGDQPGFKLVVRKLSQEDVDQLNEAGINGYSEGMDGYFYETLSTKSTPKSNTGTTTQYDNVFNKLFKDIKMDNAELESIFADPKPTPATYGQSGLKIYYGYDKDKGYVRKYAKNAAGIYEFTGNEIPQSVLKTIYR